MFLLDVLENMSEKDLKALMLVNNYYMPLGDLFVISVSDIKDKIVDTFINKRNYKVHDIPILEVTYFLFDYSNWVNCIDGFMAFNALVYEFNYNGYRYNMILLDDSIVHYSKVVKNTDSSNEISIESDEFTEAYKNHVDEIKEQLHGIISDKISGKN